MLIHLHANACTGTHTCVHPLPILGRVPSCLFKGSTDVYHWCLKEALMCNHWMFFSSPWPVSLCSCSCWLISFCLPVFLLTLLCIFWILTSACLWPQLSSWLHLLLLLWVWPRLSHWPLLCCPSMLISPCLLTTSQILAVTYPCFWSCCGGSFTSLSG